MNAYYVSDTRSDSRGNREENRAPSSKEQRQQEAGPRRVTKAAKASHGAAWIPRRHARAACGPAKGGRGTLVPSQAKRSEEQVGIRWAKREWQCMHQNALCKCQEIRGNMPSRKAKNSARLKHSIRRKGDETRLGGPASPAGRGRANDALGPGRAQPEVLWGSWGCLEGSGCRRVALGGGSGQHTGWRESALKI